MQMRKTVVLPFVIIGFFYFSADLITTFSSAEAAGLEDILYEKGILSKEDLIKAKAESEKLHEAEERRLEEEFPVKVGYGSKGFELSTRDGKYSTQIQWRLQFRYSHPTDGDPRDPQFDVRRQVVDGPNESTFQIRRARIKVGGHGYQPWLKYYFEYDWPSSRLLDWRLMVEKYKWLQLRLGQWKINYNRERVDSSGKQQFVERSIVNREFTIDRQMGVMLYGHLFRGTWADAWYYAGVFTGRGRQEINDDGRMMWMGRLQWNFLGRDLKFSQSDVEFHEKPTGSVAFGAYTDRSDCTRFSSSGCGQLDGISAFGGTGSEMSRGQFSMQGMVEETAFKWRGLSIQHEYHWKQIINKLFAADPTAITTLNTGQNVEQLNLMGAYQQIGYFPHYIFSSIPKGIEVGFRYAFVDPNISESNDLRQELTGVINWFFAGHRNKLTFDTSALSIEDPSGDQHVQRFRLQWDISF